MLNSFRAAWEELEKFKKSHPHERKLYDGPIGKLMGEKTMDLALLHFSYILDEDNAEVLFMKAQSHIYTKINQTYKVPENRVKESLGFLHQQNKESIMNEIKNSIFEILGEIMEDPTINVSKSSSNSNSASLMFSQSAQSANNSKYSLPGPSRLELSREYAPSVGTGIHEFLQGPNHYSPHTSSIYGRSVPRDQSDSRTLASLSSLSQTLNQFSISKKYTANQATGITSMSFSNDVDEYLQNSVKNYRTELSYFFQQMKAQEPKFITQKVGADFEATCTLVVPMEEGYRRPSYRDSAISANSKNAMTEAAKKVLRHVYSENPHKWQEFLRIKEKSKLMD